MLIEIKRLLIENNGYKRDVTLQRVYVNSDNIVSISDYHGAQIFCFKKIPDLQMNNFH